MHVEKGGGKTPTVGTMVQQRGPMYQSSTPWVSAPIEREEEDESEKKWEKAL